MTRTEQRPTAGGLALPPPTDRAAALLDYLRGLDRLLAGRRMTARPDGVAYSCVEAFVLARGHAPTPAPLSAAETAVVRRALGPARGYDARYPERQCYWNARKLVERSAGAIVYVEGFAMSNLGIPLLHAWGEINGKVVDPTWRADRGPVEPAARLRQRAAAPPADWAYYGVVVPDPPPADAETASLIDDWHHGWPLLRVPATPKEEHP